MNSQKVKNPFLSSLAIQIRVVKALIRREYITLSGKSGLGFLMLFGEPLVVMLFVMIMVGRSKIHATTDFPAYDFIISGWGILWLARYPIQRMGGALLGNASFLYHRNIKIFDILAARTLLMMGASVTSFVIIFILYMAISPSISIYNVYYIFFSFAYVEWYTFNICIITGILTGYTFLGDKVSILMSIIHLFASGAFFMVTWLPQEIQGYVLLSPLVDATEMMRYGFYGDKVECLFSISYMLCFNLFMSYFCLRRTYVLTKTRSLILDS